MFSTDIFLPAMPKIKQALDSTAGESQLIVSIYFFGLAISQLLSGFFSDQYGRRLTLITTLTLYIIGSIGCSISTNLDFLLISRLIQGIGAGAIVVLWRAIVVDVYDKKIAFTVISTVAPAIIVSPAIAPIIGGVLLVNFGWHSTFVALILLGLIALLITIFFLPETQKITSKENKIILNLKNHFQLLKSIPFILYGSLVCFAYGAYFSYIAQSPFILHKLNLPPIEISFFYLPITIAFLIGSQLSKKLAISLNHHKILFLGVIFFMIGSLGISITNTFNPNNVIQLIAAFLLLVVGNGILLTIGISKALTFFPQAAGAASGLVSFSQSVTAFFMTWLVAILNNTNMSSISLSLPMLIAATGVIIIFSYIHYFSLNEYFADN